MEAFERSRSALDRARRTVRSARPTPEEDLGTELRSSVVLLGSVLLPILLLILASGLG